MTTHLTDIERRSQDRRNCAKIIAFRHAAINIIFFAFGFLVAVYAITK